MSTRPEAPTTNEEGFHLNAEQFVDGIFQMFHLPRYRRDKAVRSANMIHEENLSGMDRFALMITTQVGSMGFFLLILVWTVLWVGYNLLASSLPGLHWRAFDPFPAFVAYLLISNVIQILLMPLIMVGQNLQGRHAETRAELDFEINQRAEKEIVVILRHLEHNTDLLIQLMRHLDCRITTEEYRAIQAERDLAEKLASAGIDVEAGTHTATNNRAASHS